MLRRLPPLNALKAFEAAARHESFTRAAERLIRPFKDSIRLSRTYWIICPKATSGLPKIELFQDWLLAEAAQDLRHLQSLRTKAA